MLMENKNQIKLIEVNGKSYKIDTKIYINWIKRDGFYAGKFKFTITFLL